MKRKQKFETPTVLQQVDLAFESGILLKGSIVDQVDVYSAGQEVHDLNAEDPQFDWNNQWEWE